MSMSIQKITTLDLSSLSRKAGGTSLTVQLPGLATGCYGFHILFDSRNYPLANHMCYMRPKNGESLDEHRPLKFAEMIFDPKPPGMNVGPWPGWRGIPNMPPVRLYFDNQKIAGRYNFWGDEYTAQIIRVFATVTSEKMSTPELLLEWTDSRLRPLRLEIYNKPVLTVSPQPVDLLPELADSHPRLLFSDSDAAQLRKRITGTHRNIWNKIETLLTECWDFEFTLTTESKTPEGPERLNDMDRAVLSAFHALMTESGISIPRAKSAFEDLLERALDKNYEPMTIDTQSGECLFSLCTSYDWIYRYLPDSDRAGFQEKLFQVAEKVWQHLGYERDDYGQAHFLGCSHGLLAFSLLFWNEHPRSQEWVTFLHGVFKSVLNMLPGDGFYPHGINLWIYEHTFLLRYLELLCHCTGMDYWKETTYWQNASLFRRVSLSPDAMFGITFGDPQYRVAGDAWMHYLFANRTGSVDAQALGRLLADQPVNGVDFRNVPPRRRVWEFLFYNPEMSGDSPDIKAFFFQDGGQVFLRDRLENNDLLMTFRAGPPLGEQRYQWGEWSGYGHSDPCNGSFLICKGHSFIINGPGPVYRRDTQLHNTITIEGQGQTGDGMVWAPEFTPWERFARVTKYTNTNEICEIEADLAKSYLDHLGVKRLVRRFIYLRPAVIVIHDHVELESGRTIEWNLHSYGNFQELATENGRHFEISDNKSAISLHSVLPHDATSETGLSWFVPAYPNPGTRDHFLIIRKPGKQVDFLNIFVPDDTQVAWKTDSEANWRKLSLTINQKEYLIENNATVAV